MSGGTVAGAIGGITAAGVGSAAAGALVSTGVSAGLNDILGGSSGGGGGGSSSGGGGSNLSPQLQQYTYYGPHVSTTPLGRSQEPGQSNPDMKLDEKAGKAAVATGQEADRRTSAAAQPEKVPAEFQDIWASRLSRYLDYNTRGLG